jgi:hypothetical protein
MVLMIIFSFLCEKIIGRHIELAIITRGITSEEKDAG